MSIASEWERIEDGRLLNNYRNTATNFIGQLDILFANIKPMVTKYPADATELNGYIAQLKTAVTNVLNKY
jgi:hypothetical protein